MLTLNSQKSFERQDGIYFSKGRSPPNSLSLVMLRVAPGSDANDVRNSLKMLWRMLAELKKGIVSDFATSKKHLHGDNLSVLIGYGIKIFEIAGIQKKCPADLLKYGSLNNSADTTGREVVRNSGLVYSNDIKENHAASHHIILQFIGDSEFGTTRAIVETWKQIKRIHASLGKSIFIVNRVYTGFQSLNQRNWMGFHDGISNIRSEKRADAIFVDRSSLSYDDNWMVGGTYLAFLRLAIDLESWEQIDVSQQELLMGRDKNTGCPLIGIDKNGRPVKDFRCPIKGTTEISESGNEQFRDHPPYGYQKNKPYNIKDEVLKYSHIGLPRQIDPKSAKLMSQIFRQGYQFLESTDENFPFRVGFNFISYQKSPRTIYEMLKYGFPKSDENLKVSKFYDFFSLRAAGIFVVPPLRREEFFPGESIFGRSNTLNHTRYQYRLNRRSTN